MEKIETYKFRDIGLEVMGYDFNDGLLSLREIKDTDVFVAFIKDGWRVPNIKELLYLCNLSNVNPTGKIMNFRGEDPFWYWSSDELMPGRNRVVNFMNKKVSVTLSISSCRLRLVRDI